MSIAFFDIDRTLIGVNSASLWLKKELREGRIGFFGALRGAFWLALYELGFVRMESVLRSAVASLRGTPEAEVAARTREFFLEEIRATVRPGSRSAIDLHRARGHKLVLLTSSSPYLASLLADDLAMDDFLCNRFEVESGLFTGRAVDPLCFGAGKLEHAARYAAGLDVRLADCAFYTDSFSDLPVLAAVGTPVVVNPDRRLRREAAARSWPVHDWGQAALLLPAARR